MSTGVTSKQLNKLHKMTDAEFTNVIIVLAGIALPAGAQSSGFFARFAETRAAGYLKNIEVRNAIYTFLGVVFAKALDGGVDADWVRAAVIKVIFEHTGLEIETLDAEGAKKAAGKLMADKFNEQHGTTFTNFYPPSEMLEQIRAQIESEIIEALA